ncbi:MAG: DUF3592 domain-containing protein [Pseudomonadota bacterium]
MGCRTLYPFNLPTGVWLAALASVIAAITTAHIALVRIPLEDALDARGRTATGAVTAIDEKFRFRTRRGAGRQRRVSYAFNAADGVRVTGAADVSRHRARALSVGDAVTARYLPDRPDRHQVSLERLAPGREALRNGAAFTLAAGAVAAVFAAFAPAGWSGPRVWPPFTQTLE